MSGETIYLRRMSGRVSSSESTCAGWHRVGRWLWELLYVTGRMNYLWERRRDARYVRIAETVLASGETSMSLLDVGCGEGILRRHMPAEQVSRFVGIDLCRVAVSRARAKYPADEFLTVDAQAYQTDERFDWIVFCDSLYYVAQPVSLVRHFQQFLSPRGQIVLVLYRDPRTVLYWERLKEQFSGQFEEFDAPDDGPYFAILRGRSEATHTA